MTQFSQFTEVAKKDIQSLLPLSFFQATELKFKDELEKSVQRINNGSNLETEVMTLGNFCHSEFETIQEQANKKFMEWVGEHFEGPEKALRNTIEMKDEEIKELRATLEELLSRSPDLLESIKKYDKRRREAEENVRKVQSMEENTKIPEMVTKDRVSGILEDIFEELNSIKEEVQQNQRDTAENVERVLGQTQYMYKVNVKSLIRDLKHQYSINLETISSQYQEKNEKIKEAYEAQKKLLNNMIDEITKHNLELEKEKELHTQISRVFISNPSLKPEKIMIKSIDILRQDPQSRYNTVKSCYDKFVLFVELFSNKEELSIIETYLNQMNNLVPKLERIMSCQVNWGRLFDAYGDVKEFARSRNYRQWCGSHKYDRLFADKVKGGGPGFRDGWMNPNADYYSHHIGHLIMDDFNNENNRRKNHNEELQRQIQNINFPSKEFDSFLKQFNIFVSKL